MVSTETAQGKNAKILNDQIINKFYISTDMYIYMNIARSLYYNSIHHNNPF